MGERQSKDRYQSVWHVYLRREQNNYKEQKAVLAAFFVVVSFWTILPVTDDNRYSDCNKLSCGCNKDSVIN